MTGDRQSTRRALSDSRKSLSASARGVALSWIGKPFLGRMRPEFPSTAKPTMTPINRTAARPFIGGRQISL